MDFIVELYIRRNGPEFTLRQVAEGFRRVMTVYPECTNPIAVKEIRFILGELTSLINAVEKLEYSAQHGTREDQSDATKC